MNDAFVQDQCSETSTMNQTAHDTTLRELLQIFARLAKARAAHDHSPDEKFLIYEVVKRDTRGCNVTPGIRGAEPDSEPLPTGIEHAAEKRLNGLNLDQCDFAPAVARSLRIVARPGEVP